jgi:general secretion pathway protein I
MFRTLTRGDAGVSLIEVAIAVLILSIALIGTFRVIDQGTRQVSGERERVLGRLVAQNRAAEMRLAQPGLAETVDLGGRRWVVRTGDARTSAGFDEVEILVTPAGGGATSRLVTYLDAGDAR